MADVKHPRERANQVGREAFEAELYALLVNGSLSHGWIIAGPHGSGKATLAYRLARGLLDPSAIIKKGSFDVSPDCQTFKLVAGAAHPDLLTLARPWDEKTSKYKAEIPIDSVRSLITFLNRTPAYGGARVAIIDTADDLNRNAANALLKVLEEPPKNCALFVLASQPGRLLPTIRSRCKQIDLRAVDDDLILGLLEAEGAASGADAVSIAAHAAGRPGYAIQLAMKNGAEAINLAHKFLAATMSAGATTQIASKLSVKGADDLWLIFKETTLQTLIDGACSAATGHSLDGPLKGANPQSLLTAWEQASALITRGEALNLDRSQLINALAYDMRAVFRAAA